VNWRGYGYKCYNVHDYKIYVAYFSELFLFLAASFFQPVEVDFQLAHKPPADRGNDRHFSISEDVEPKKASLCR
jgi:hypothetical protein